MKIKDTPESFMALYDAVKFAIKRLGFESGTLPLGSDLVLRDMLVAARNKAESK